MAVTQVRLKFGKGGITATPETAEVSAGGTVCWKVDAPPADEVTIDFKEKSKKGTKVKGPFKKHAAQPKRGVFRVTGAGLCNSAAVDQPGTANGEDWKYDVVWKKGNTVSRLDPKIKIRN
jgi:hypothetical protein